MKKGLLFLGIPLCVIIASSAYALTVSGTATATIKKALTATQNTPMSFATIQAPTTGGTVTLSPAGAISTTATGFTFSGSPAAANFTITGDANSVLVVSFVNGTLSSSGATDMVLQNFTTSPSGTGITTGTTGSLSLNVGADLIVNANQQSGSYNGTFSMTVNY